MGIIQIMWIHLYMDSSQNFEFVTRNKLISQNNLDYLRKKTNQI